MYYIILGIITIIAFGIDIYFLLIVGKLLWERMTTGEKTLKIICWVLGFLTAITLIVKGVNPAHGEVENLDPIATIENVNQ